MKMELNREEMIDAVKCYLHKQGIDVKNKDINITVGRGTTTVNIEDKQVETLIDTDGENPFNNLS